MKKIIILIIVTLMLANTFFIYNLIFEKSILTKIFGFGILIVNSGSMNPEISVGELIIIKEKDSYKVGDIVTISVDNEYLVTHRIIDVKDNKYITKGDNNNCIDEKDIEYQEIEGKVIFHSKLLGKVYQFRYYLIILFILILIYLIIF